VLVGDHHQLPELTAGGAFRALATTLHAHGAAAEPATGRVLGTRRPRPAAQWRCRPGTGRLRPGRPGAAGRHRCDARCAFARAADFSCDHDQRQAQLRSLTTTLASGEPITIVLRSAIARSRPCVCRAQRPRCATSPASRS
jgi:hypothetical protein